MSHCIRSCLRQIFVQGVAKIVYTLVVLVCQNRVEMYLAKSSYIQRDSREIYAESFYKFAVQLSDNARYFTESGRMFLSMFNLYRFHMATFVLLYFAYNYTVVHEYTLNTNGKTQILKILVQHV